MKNYISGGKEVKGEKKEFRGGDALYEIRKTEL
jgi:hypothetical protein